MYEVWVNKSCVSIITDFFSVLQESIILRLNKKLIKEICSLLAFVLSMELVY